MEEEEQCQADKMRNNNWYGNLWDNGQSKEPDEEAEDGGNKYRTRFSAREYARRGTTITNHAELIGHAVVSRKKSIPYPQKDAEEHYISTMVPGQVLMIYAGKFRTFIHFQIRLH